MSETSNPSGVPHRRRPRYAGKYPRKFEEKYKEHDPYRYTETVAKVLASGKTPAGTHRPIMVAEILEVLTPKPGDLVVDCTLGHGGHAEALLKRVLPGGMVLGLDVDPLELPRTEARLRQLGFGDDVFVPIRSNFAGLQKILASRGYSGADIVLADLGVSSMQLDNPARGFSVREDGPLDMRMNPERGQPVSALLATLSANSLETILQENADEPRAELLSQALAGHSFVTTRQLSRAIENALPRVGEEERELTVRRVFQALRIEVNDEFSALDAFLRQLPYALKPGGKAAVLTFHSGEDRRVKKAFLAGERDGTYSRVAREVIRATPEERRENPRSTPAKLRWAQRA